MREPARPTLYLDPSPTSPREWLRSIWEHRQVIRVLARKDFQARYKRASLGVLWAVVVPLLQATVLIIIFSRIVKVGQGIPYGAFVLTGVLPWSYFSSTLPVGTTSIVDGSSLTDKIWFPRGVLAIVPCISGLVGLGISMTILVVGAVLLGADLSFRLFLIVPACLLLVSFTMGLTLVSSALQVYFRDVRFIAAASLQVWLYITPVMYPKAAVGRIGPWLDINPLTGIISLFHSAAIGDVDPSLRAVAVSVATTIVLLVSAIEAHRRHDRVFVDLL